jgi:hypothetical protein
LKPLLSFFVVFILFHSLIFRSLSGIEIRAAYPDKQGEIHLSNQLPVGSYLRPNHTTPLQNYHFKNQGHPFQFVTDFVNKSTSAEVAEISPNHTIRYFYSSVSVFLFCGELRL